MNDDAGRSSLPDVDDAHAPPLIPRPGPPKMLLRQGVALLALLAGLALLVWWTRLTERDLAVALVCFALGRSLPRPRR